jgi:hypothetical protein
MMALFGEHPNVTAAPPTRPAESYADCNTNKDDWARGTRLLVIWCLPIAILLVSAWIGGRYLIVVWPPLLTWMGVACLLNARRCRRLHCYLTGPYFLLLALTALLYGLGVVPLGSRGWGMLSLALVVVGPLLVYVPEWILGRYRRPEVDRGP